MLTRCLNVSADSPEADVIATAAAVIRRGGTVAFPTETVYGLGANALDPAAVLGIFRAKDRPANNPLIVHVTSVADAQRLVAEWPEAARCLAECFWPGPLTLVLRKQSHVPDEVTAGGATVAIRIPEHRVARALIDAAGTPIAAPSANRSNRVSATTAEHVLRTLEGRIDLVLDGGPAPGGIESTVIDVSVSPPRVLRLGLVTPRELELALGAEVVVPTNAIHAGQVAPSPGMLLRHYAPLVPLELVDDDQARVAELAAMPCRVGWLSLGETPSLNLHNLQQIAMPPTPAEYARRLYHALYQLEASGIERIVVKRPPPSDDWAAIHDRLRRASAGEV